MASAVRQEVHDVVRGACGGMLFGVPLLYTMEVWWIGSLTRPALLLGVLAAAFAVVFLLNRTSGFRSTRDVRLSDSVKDSIEALAIGLVSVFVILVLIREVTLDSPVREALGKIVYEATPFTIGVGLAAHFLRGDRTANDEDGDGGSSERHINPTLADVGATLLGAVFIAFNIAPTDEIPMITSAMSPAWILAAVAVSLLLSYGIVFAAGFSSEQSRRVQAGVMQHPITETLVCYLLALAVSCALLWFFQQWAPGDPLDVVLQRTIVLGLPATVGGAAGRLAV